MNTQLSRTSTDGDKQIKTLYSCSIPKIILLITDIGGEIDIVGERIKELLRTHQGHGSGFELDTILDCQLQVTNNNKIGGSSHVPLPEYIQSKTATINIKNVSDKNCSQYAMLYTKLQPASDPQRPDQYKKYIGELHMTGITTPVKITQIKKFEKLKKKQYSVNDHALDSSKKRSRDNHEEHIKTYK